MYRTEQKFSFSWVLFVSVTEQMFYRISFDKGINAYCGWLENDTLSSQQYSKFQTSSTFHIGAFLFKTELS